MTQFSVPPKFALWFDAAVMAGLNSLMASVELEEVDVQRLGARSGTDFRDPLHMVVQRHVGVMRDRQCAHHPWRVERGRCEVVHRPPVPVRLEDVPEALLGEVPDVELRVAGVEEHTRGGH